MPLWSITTIASGTVSRIERNSADSLATASVPGLPAFRLMRCRNTTCYARRIPMSGAEPGFLAPAGIGEVDDIATVHTEGHQDTRRATGTVCPLLSLSMSRYLFGQILA